MKKKPSELPVHSVIKDKEQGLFFKDQLQEGVFVWWDMAPHCADCCDTISEKGLNSDEKPEKYAPGITQSEPADEYFKDYEILAMGV